MTVPAVLPAAPAGASQLARSGTDHPPEQPTAGEGHRAAHGMSWPLRPTPAVTRPFEPPACRYCPGHRGVDLAADPGQPVRAAAGGVVIHAGRLADRYVISIDHGTLRTTYEPVRPAVRVGQTVREGERIGVAVPGHPGCTVTACVHWGLRRGAEYLDPLVAVAGGTLRLKPVRSPPG
ncbi:M23 family metallopeptidase [Haloechinothrix sp. LS1_15]|nr:M23 family metallopeptidase [Haloechinothrix sp. LS1_15]